jgi:cAMP and cAMP-inhibited cGMP 3',5'-cyclic phosphodiesterase 10
MNSRLGDECFTRDDEEAFGMFAVYCALALHYSKLYNILTKEELMHTVV